LLKQKKSSSFFFFFLSRQTISGIGFHGGIELLGEIFASADVKLAFDSYFR